MSSLERHVAGLADVLQRVVAPTVEDDHARRVLDGVIGSLVVLAPALPSLPGFLSRDTEATLALVEGVARGLAPDRRAELLAAIAEVERQEPWSDATSSAARALLASCAPEVPVGSDIHREALRHLADRARSHPLRAAARLPPSPPAESSPAC